MITFESFKLQMNLMAKDTLVKLPKPTSIRLGNLKAPIQKKAMELDRSLNWLVCKMLKDHPYLKDFLESHPKSKT